MPFIGLQNDRPVLPLEVGDSAVVRCPRCDGEMGVRAGEAIARHFWHPPDVSPPDGSNCSGESAAHIEMKHIAAEKLLGNYPAAETRIEHTVGTGERRADVCVLFTEPRHPLGRGIAVEVQYRHSQKSILNTTEDYLQNGFSVMWLDERDYDGDSPDFDDVHLTDPFPVWPYAVPHPPENESLSATVSPSLSLTEREILPHLNDKQIGQQSLAAFADPDSDDDTGEASELSLETATWSLERDISLSLSPTDTATEELIRTLLEYELERRESDQDLQARVRQYQQNAASSDRDCHLSEWFRGGKRDGFELGFLMRPDGTPRQLSLRNRRQGQQFNISVNRRVAPMVTDLVVAIVTELLAVSERTPNRSGRESVWSHAFEIGHQRVVCAVERTRGEWVGLSLTRLQPRENDQEAIRVRVLRDDIAQLVSLCARIRLHEQ
uniref:competence protein CoiA family protein n=1 Tax=Haloarcula brevis TaxID=3111453 RepID=UPI00387E464A